MARTMQETVQDWYNNNNINIHAAIRYVVNHGGSVAKDDLVDYLASMSDDPDGAVGSMCSASGNNYGDVFVNNNGMISINPLWVSEIQKYQW